MSQTKESSTKKFVLKDTETNEIVKWTISEILENINRDRSNEWTDYDKTDWRDGLENFTYWVIIKEDATQPQ